LRARSAAFRSGSVLSGSRGRQSLRGGRELLPLERRSQSGAHRDGQRAARGRSPAGAVRMTALAALRRHWPEYLMEAAGLGVFLPACLFTTLLEHPGSPVRQGIAAPVLRRVLMGLAMGATAVGIVYSRWGQPSGAHPNPSVPLTLLF